MQYQECKILDEQQRECFLKYLEMKIQEFSEELLAAKTINEVAILRRLLEARGSAIINTASDNRG